MAEENVTPVSAEAPTEAVSSEAVVTPSEVKAPETDGTTVATGETFNEKIDPKTLSGESLRIYKKYQADYTRARQADKAKFETLQNQISSFQPLMNDPDVRAKAYYLQYGKYPEGYQPTYLPPQKAQEEQINPDEIQDPVVKQLYLDNLKFRQESEARAKADYEKMVDTTNKGVKSFYEGLAPAHKTLWQENIKDITENATLYAQKGLPVDQALKKAFNAACADKLVELGKLDAINAMKKKAETPKPETSVNVGEIVQGDFKTPQEAVRAAIASVRNQ